VALFFEIREIGRGRHKKCELWRSFDFGDGCPVRLELEGVFDDYMQASAFRTELRGEKSLTNQKRS